MPMFYSPSQPLPTYTYATLPAAAAVSVGTRVRASDIGISPGMQLVSDGTRWIPDGVQVLARSAVAASCPADTTEDILATITVPAGFLGVNGSLRVESGWSNTSSGNTKTLRIRLGGVSGTVFTSIAQTTNANSELTGLIFNRNSASSQYGKFAGNRASDFVVTLLTFTAGTINTAIAQDLVLTGQKATAGETLTLDSYLVEAMP